MLRVTYDPNDGIVVPDGKTEQWTADVLSKWLEAGKPDTNITVGSALMVDQFRLKAKQEVFDSSEFMFVFYGKEIALYQGGRCSHWPNGFCDHSENILMQLI